MKNLCLFVFLFCCPWLANSLEDDICFKKGQCMQSSPTLSSFVDSEYSCRQECQMNPLCNWFTYFKKSTNCQQFKNCVTLDQNSCTDCLTGEKDCSPPEMKCWLKGKCDGKPIIVNTTQTSEGCLRLCQETDDCAWFSFDERKSLCHLFNNFRGLVSCDSCISGNSKCDPDSKGSKNIYYVIV